jgi:hypothetical protein
MTAIDAAIVELEAHREHTAQLIAAMRRFAAIVETAHTPDVVTVPTPPTADNLPRPATRAATAAKADQVLPSEYARIIEALRRAGKPLSKSELTKAAKTTDYRLTLALKRLVTDTRVVAHGATSARVYTLANHTPRSGPAAGTPSGPAGGSGPDPRRSPEFETVWNGTKERAGEAPTLLLPRERKP